MTIPFACDIFLFVIDNVLSGVGVENMNQEILKKDEKMSDWWLGTVGLTFSPVVISVIIDLCAYGRVDFGGLIGDGELILSAFLINAPSLLNYYNAALNGNNCKNLFCFQIIISFFQLIAYVAVKVGPNRRAGIIYIASGLCVGSSVIASWIGEKYLKKETRKE